jgi:hypothetical protein
MEKDVENEQNEITHVANQEKKKKYTIKIKKITKHKLQKVCSKKQCNDLHQE